MGHLRLTIGYLMATVVHIRVTLGHLKVTIGNFFSELHPKVRQTCFYSIFPIKNFSLLNYFFIENIFSFKNICSPFKYFLPLNYLF